MSSYTPPEDNLPIFNTSDFESSGTTANVDQQQVNTNTANIAQNTSNFNNVQVVLNNQSTQLTNLTNTIANKQDVIQDGDLSIAKTANLQTNLNNLSSSISTGLATKQNTLTAGTGIAISGTNEITATGLASKQDAFTAGNGLAFAGSVLNSEVSTTSLNTALSSKQDTLSFDPPSSNTTNPSTSSQIKSALDLKQDFRINGDYFIGSNVSRVCITNSTDGRIEESDITKSELDKLDGVSSNIQNQLDAKQNTLTFDQPSSNTNNPSTSAQIKSALDLKQDTLTFSAPSDNNSNPSTSAQIKSALDLKQNTIDASNRINCEFVGSGNITDTELDALDGYNSAQTIETRLGNLTTSLNTAISNITNNTNAINTNATNLSTNTSTISTLNSALAGKQDNITAGTGLSFNGNTLNATAQSASVGTGNRAVVSDSNGNLIASNTTDTEIDNLSGTTSSIQNQLNQKLNKTSVSSLTLTTSFNPITLGGRTYIFETDGDFVSAGFLKKHSQQTLSSPEQNMFRMRNMCFVNNFSVMPTTSNQNSVYHPDFYSGTKGDLVQSLPLKGLLDTECFRIVVRPDGNSTHNTASVLTGTNARYGIKILKAGLYKYTYTINIENETHNQRMTTRHAVALTYTDQGGTERYTVIDSSITQEYQRDDNFGQYGSSTCSGYFGIVPAFVANDNGVFFKLEVRQSRTAGETFQNPVNSIRCGFGNIHLERVANNAE